MRALTPTSMLAPRASPGLRFTIAGLVLAGFLYALLSWDFVGRTASGTFRSQPFGLIAVALADAAVFTAFGVRSRSAGWRLGASVFLVFYGVTYGLTALETVYVPNVLPPSSLSSLLANGAIVAGAFSAALVVLLGRAKRAAAQPTGAEPSTSRLGFGRVGIAALVYLLLFILVGIVVYDPLARVMDSSALAAEQGAIPASAASLVFLIELLRGGLWTLLAIPAIHSLPTPWRANGLLVGLLFAVPVAGAVGLSTTIAAGLVPAHIAEIVVENLLFGVTLAWLFRVRTTNPDRTAPAVLADHPPPIAPRPDVRAEVPVAARGREPWDASRVTGPMRIPSTSPPTPDATMASRGPEGRRRGLRAPARPSSEFDPSLMAGGPGPSFEGRRKR